MKLAMVLALLLVLCSCIQEVTHQSPEEITISYDPTVDDVDDLMLRAIAHCRRNSRVAILDDSWECELGGLEPCKARFLCVGAFAK